MKWQALFVYKNLDPTTENGRKIKKPVSWVGIKLFL